MVGEPHFRWDDAPEDIVAQYDDGRLITIPCNPRRYVDLMRNKKTPDNRYACRGLRTSRYTFVVNGDGDWMLKEQRHKLEEAATENVGE